jgi:pimeloyl-ACP methyl ester carboxylesterase
VTQFHFGSSDRKLFGVYHAPAGMAEGKRRPAVLLCNPFGVEAIRANRIFRVLAEHLARAGFPVLRFDYYGTGDSAGDDDAFDLGVAEENILTAHQELLDMSGTQRVVWLGLRLGAGLALRAAAHKPRNLAGLMLWEPVLSGAAYREEMAQSHLVQLAQIFDTSQGQIIKTRDEAALQNQACGVPLSASLLTQFEAFDASMVTERPARTVMLIGGEEEMTVPLATSLEDAGARVSQHALPDEKDWNNDDALNGFFVPLKTVKLVTSLAETIR